MNYTIKCIGIASYRELGTIGHMLPHFQQFIFRLHFRAIQSMMVIAHVKLEGKYSLESTDPCESKIRAPPQLTIALKLSYYLFIIAKLFKVKDGCLQCFDAVGWAAGRASGL